MSNQGELIRYLEKDLRDWEEAAQFYEKNIHSVTDIDEQVKWSGMQEAEKFKKRIAERKELIDRLKKDSAATTKNS